ncbi:hypothetical protein OT109_15110 [Phycisphaeraceae bacterium D3-23]
MHRLNLCAWPTIAAAVFVACPLSAQPAQEVEPAEAVTPADEQREGVVGTWYAQKLQGEWVAAEAEFRLEFRDDGTAHFFENGRAEEEGVAYVIDAERSMITISEPEMQMVIEFEFIQFDDVMILTMLPIEGMEQAFAGQDMDIVLSRRPEGNEDHQRERAALVEGTGRGAMGGNGPPMEEDITPEELALWNLEDLAMYAYEWRFEEGTFPARLSELLAYDLDAACFLQPGQSDVLPENFGELSEADRAAWIDAHTGYGYIGSDAATLADKKEQWDMVLIFELPLYEGAESVNVVYVEGSTRTLEYDEADALIAAQTGRDLMAWMEHMGREQLPPRETAEDAAERAGDSADEAGGHDHDEGDAAPMRDGGHFHADGTYHDNDHDHDEAHE